MPPIKRYFCILFLCRLTVVPSNLGRIARESQIQSCSFSRCGFVNMWQRKNSNWFNSAACNNPFSANVSAQYAAAFSDCRNKKIVSNCSRIIGSKLTPECPITNNLWWLCRNRVKTLIKPLSRLIVSADSSTITTICCEPQTTRQKLSSLSVTQEWLPHCSRLGSNTSERFRCFTQNWLDNALANVVLPDSFGPKMPAEMISTIYAFFRPIFVLSQVHPILSLSLVVGWLTRGAA